MGAESRELRVVLDAQATMAYEAMLTRMKELVPQIKAQPSHFVSFLLVDYLEAHFEKDKAVLVAEFFDMDTFFDSERKLAKGQPDYEERVQAALDRARQIKGKRRRKTVRKKRQAAEPIKDGAA
jgi:hypothetical protein